MKLKDKLAAPLFLWAVTLIFFLFCVASSFIDMKSLGM